MHRHTLAHMHMRAHAHTHGPLAFGACVGTAGNVEHIRRSPVHGPGKHLGSSGGAGQNGKAQRHGLEVEQLVTFEQSSPAHTAIPAKMRYSRHEHTQDIICAAPVKANAERSEHGRG